MSINLEWSKYLYLTPEYADMLNDKVYLEAWSMFLKNNSNNFPENELIIISGDLTIIQNKMVLEYVLFNNTDRAVKDVEIGVKLSVLGKDYFEGTLRTQKDCYGDLLPFSARLDFGNDRYDDQKLSPADYELQV